MKITAYDIINELGATGNPYSRDRENRQFLYYLHILGFLAGFLATEMARDASLALRFRRVVERQKNR